MMFQSFRTPNYRGFGIDGFAFFRIDYIMKIGFKKFVL
jgi:hypothetical protein